MSESELVMKVAKAFRKRMFDDLEPFGVTPEANMDVELMLARLAIETIIPELPPDAAEKLRLSLNNE